MQERDKIRLLIMASSELDDKEKFYQEIDKFIDTNKSYVSLGWYKSSDVELVTCGSPNIDKLVEEYRNNRGYELTTIKANHLKDKSNAINIRNAKAKNLANCFIAFWNGDSYGIKEMIDNHITDDMVQLYIYVENRKIKDNGKPAITL